MKDERARVLVDSGGVKTELLVDSGDEQNVEWITKPFLQAQGVNWIDSCCLSVAHVNAMGSNQAGRRELPPELIARASRIVVDSIEQSRMESGDLVLAWTPDQWTDRRLVELEDVVAGKCAGREDPDQITIFKSNGLALEDVAAAGHIYERALEAGMGRSMSALYS